MKSPHLMMRPMLLSHIDDLLTTTTNLKYSFQIYEILINQWLIRESNKAGIVKKYGKGYSKLLFEFSKALARDLYLKRKLRGNKLSVNVNEIISKQNGLQLKDLEDNQIMIDKSDQSSRSLLNRDLTGEYKFPHKSILEYLLALQVIEDSNFRRKFTFSSDLDTAKKFFFEMISHRKINISDLLKNRTLGLTSEEIDSAYGNVSITFISHG